MPTSPHSPALIRHYLNEWNELKEEAWRLGSSAQPQHSMPGSSCPLAHCEVWC